MNTQKPKEIKVVARTRSGETLKGWVAEVSLETLSQNRPVFLRLAQPSNTVGTYISQDQLSGFFIVNTFEGNQASLLSKTWFDLCRTLKPHLSVIAGATLVALLSVTGLIALL